MEDYYLLFIFFEFCLIYCINSKNSENINMLKGKSNFFGEHHPSPSPNVLPFGPHGSDSDNIFFKIEQLLIREKDLDNLYHSEHDKFVNYQNQLKTQKIYLLFLIVITSVLFLILAIYSIRQYLKCRRKTKKKLLNKKNDLINSVESEIVSSFSTFDSYKNNNNSIENVSNDLSISNNFYILIKSKKIENDEINIDNKDSDEAPIEYIEKNKENNFEDNMKTLTNNEDLFLESNTDKLLYKPYSEDEINKS